MNDYVLFYIVFLMYKPNQQFLGTFWIKSIYPSPWAPFACDVSPVNSWSCGRCVLSSSAQPHLEIFPVQETEWESNEVFTFGWANMSGITTANRFLKCTEMDSTFTPFAAQASPSWICVSTVMPASNNSSIISDIADPSMDLLVPFQWQSSFSQWIHLVFFIRTMLIRTSRLRFVFVLLVAISFQSSEKI